MFSTGLASCSYDGGTHYVTSAKIYLVNETPEIVTNSVYKILPNETIVHISTYSNDYFEKPTAETYQPSFSTAGGYKFYYGEVGDAIKCEYGLTDVENYENRIALPERNDTLFFEMTFRFTEERKIEAKDCL